MKILLIHIGLGESGFNSFGKNLGTSQINHGLCLISAYAKSQGFNNIRLIDLRTLKGWEDFRENVSRYEPDVAGVSFMSCDFNMADRVIKIIKDVSSQIKIVVGGVHASVSTKEVADNRLVDHIIVGEGEISFVNLLKNINAGQKSGRIIKGVKPNLDKLPFENREIFNYGSAIKFVNFPGIFSSPMVSIVASRGCPFNCAFCAPHAKVVFGPKVRYRGVDHVVREIGELHEKYRFKSLAFYDYSLFLNEEWMHEFCDRFQRENFKAQIWANCRADLICRHEKSIKRLRNIGLKMMAIGMESGSQRMLDFMKKGTTVEQNIKATEICKRNGIIVRGLFMLGLPTERKEDVKATLDLIRKTKPDVYSFSYFTPMPGTHLYKYCQERNLSLVKSYDDLANMGPDIPKIRDVDYRFLKKSVDEAMGYRFGGKTVGKFIRFAFVRTRKGRLLAARQFLKYLYVKWVLIRSAFNIP